MDGSNDRLSGFFQQQDDAIEVGLHHGLGRAEFTDVGAAGEGFARARDDDGLDSRICQCLSHTVGNADPGGVPQAVDRRVVERDKGDIALNLVMRCHAGFPSRDAAMGRRGDGEAK